MTTIELVSTAKQLIKASNHGNHPQLIEILQSFQTRNTLAWCQDSINWTIGSLMYCLDRTTNTSRHQLVPIAFKILTKLLKNPKTHSRILSGLRIFSNPHHTPHSVLIIPRLIVWIDEYQHIPESFFLAHELIQLQIEYPNHDQFEGLLPTLLNQIQQRIHTCHKHPLDSITIETLEWIWKHFPIAFDQLINRFDRRTRHHVIGKLKIQWPRGWMYESRATKVVWWKKQGFFRQLT